MHAIEPFVKPAVYRSLGVIPEGKALDRGFYVLHPWKDRIDVPGRFEAIASLPVALVIDEDQRTLARLYGRHGDDGKAISVYAKR